MSPSLFIGEIGLEAWRQWWWRTMTTANDWLVDRVLRWTLHIADDLHNGHRNWIAILYWSSYKSDVVGRASRVTCVHEDLIWEQMVNSCSSDHSSVHLGSINQFIDIAGLSTEFKPTYTSMTRQNEKPLWKMVDKNLAHRENVKGTIAIVIARLQFSRTCRSLFPYELHLCIHRAAILLQVLRLYCAMCMFGWQQQTGPNSQPMGKLHRPYLFCFTASSQLNTLPLRMRTPSAALFAYNILKRSRKTTFFRSHRSPLMRSALGSVWVNICVYLCKIYSFVRGYNGTNTAHSNINCPFSTLCPSN